MKYFFTLGTSFYVLQINIYQSYVAYIVFAGAVWKSCFVFALLIQGSSGPFLQ